MSSGSGDDIFFWRFVCIAAGVVIIVIALISAIAAIQL